LILELQYLLNNYKNILFGAYVHGSMATGEQIFYSDFDGLLIIEDSDKKNFKKLKILINKTLKIIYKIDPLQHHGWFIINKSQLTDYPQTYFPFEIFELSKSLLPDNGLSFKIVIPDNIDYLTPFCDLKNKLINTISFNKPNNLYTLKSFLSVFMLIPSLYLQAKLKKGYNKKFSFDIARKDFTEMEWQSIETASYIRKMWKYNLNPFQKYIMTRAGKYFRKFTKLFISPKIPDEYKILLNEDFYYKVSLLLEKMNSNINALN
jgi:hypothetical protein